MSRTDRLPVLRWGITPNIPAHFPEHFPRKAFGWLWIGDLDFSRSHNFLCELGKQIHFSGSPFPGRKVGPWSSSCPFPPYKYIAGFPSTYDRMIRCFDWNQKLRPSGQALQASPAVSHYHLALRLPRPLKHSIQDCYPITGQLSSKLQLKHTRAKLFPPGDHTAWPGLARPETCASGDLPVHQTQRPPHLSRCSPRTGKRQNRR